METKLASIIDVFDESSVRGLILRTLAQEWPLTARKLHSKISQKKQLGYHAIYKSINQMVKEGILKKEENGYLVNIEWLEKVDSVFSRMRGQIGTKPMYIPRLSDIKQEGENHSFVFENLAEADRYRKKLQSEYLESKESKKPYVGLSYHMRSPLVYAEKSAKTTDVVSKQRIPVFLLIEGNTPVDEWCADYYRFLSLKVRTGMKGTVHNCEIMVVGDHIVQMFLPKKTNEYIDSLYGRMSHASEISIPEFYSKVFLEKSDVKIVVTKNSALAEQIRQNAISKFATDRVAVFSVLGTFVDYSLYYEIAKNLDEKGLLNTDEGKELLKLGESWKKGKIKQDTYLESYVSHYANAVKGRSTSDIEEAIKSVVDDNITNILLKNAAKLMSFACSYTDTAAITRMPLEFVKGLEPYVIFNHIIATALEAKKGVYTGKILHNLISQKAKEKAFLQWSKNRNMKGSLGFGNRSSDLGFLKHVEIPILVNPSGRMQSYAKKHKWKSYGKKEIGYLVEYVKEELRSDA
ncbi:MAG: hypothetical protein HYW25_05050 [Candidatus Aenigmarchaeota archaeon]|nr:hypothetical protein [Candidatus Aenigmarchaeota archaeon]